MSRKINPRQVISVLRKAAGSYTDPKAAKVKGIKGAANSADLTPMAAGDAKSPGPVPQNKHAFDISAMPIRLAEKQAFGGALGSLAGGAPGGPGAGAGPLANRGPMPSMPPAPPAPPMGGNPDQMPMGELGRMLGQQLGGSPTPPPAGPNQGLPGPAVGKVPQMPPAQQKPMGSLSTADMQTGPSRLGEMEKQFACKLAMITAGPASMVQRVPSMGSQRDKDKAQQKARQKLV